MIQYVCIECVVFRVYIVCVLNVKCVLCALYVYTVLSVCVCARVCSDRLNGFKMFSPARFTTASHTGRPADSRSV